MNKLSVYTARVKITYRHIHPGTDRCDIEMGISPLSVLTETIFLSDVLVCCNWLLVGCLPNHEASYIYLSSFVVRGRLEIPMQMAYFVFHFALIFKKSMNSD